MIVSPPANHRPLSGADRRPGRIGAGCPSAHGQCKGELLGALDVGKRQRGNRLQQRSLGLQFLAELGIAASQFAQRANAFRPQVTVLAVQQPPQQYPSRILWPFLPGRFGQAQHRRGAQRDVPPARRPLPGAAVRHVRAAAKTGASARLPTSRSDHPRTTSWPADGRPVPGRPQRPVAAPPRPPRRAAPHHGVMATRTFPLASRRIRLDPCRPTARASPAPPGTTRS